MPAGSHMRQRLEAEKRAYALLRLLVPADEWHETYIEFTTDKGRTYKIFLSGTVDNIQMTNRQGNIRRICGGPFLWNDYLDVENLRQNGYCRVRDADYTRASRNGTLMSLPNADYWLGQYLALKYDEEEFLRHAVVSSYY